MKSSMTTHTISTRVYNQDQSWYFERTSLVNIGKTNFKLKVSIRRNAYDSQSYARVHLWSDTKWELVVEAPITECNCDDVTYVEKGITESHFNADHNRLFTEAIKIIL